MEGERGREGGKNEAKQGENWLFAFINIENVHND